jgi:Co/Zn/Cd efflux system component
MVESETGGLASVRRPFVWVALVISAAFTVFEFARAFTAGFAWSLFVDATHNAFHTYVLGRIVWAVGAAKRDPAQGERLDARIGCELGWLLLAGGIVYGLATLPLRHPVDGWTVATTGGAGAVFAVITWVLLKLSGDGSSTLRGGHLDTAGDFAASVLALAAGLAQEWWSASAADAAAAALAALGMVAFGWLQLRESRDKLRRIPGSGRRA